MKKFIESIQEFRKKSRGNAILFFCFYLFFFLILAVFLRTSRYHSTPIKYEYEGGKKYNFSFNELLNQNYSYTYDVILDDKTYHYVGKKDKEKSLYSYQEKEYYVFKDITYVKNDKWEKIDSPYLFEDFYQENDIRSLIEASTYLSKTSYESGKNVYTFLLSSNTINQLLYGISSDFFEEPNRVVVSVNEKNIIEEIHFYFNSYCMVNKMCQKNLDIKMNYSDYGKITIDEVEVPVS